MKFKIDIWLSEDEIKKAIIAKAAERVDIGVPLKEYDIALYSLSLKEAHIEIIPDRVNQENKK